MKIVKKLIENKIGSSTFTPMWLLLIAVTIVLIAFIIVFNYIG